MIFKKLLIAKNYKGSLKSEIIPQNKFYLYGLRNDQGIINLEYTVLNLKRSIKLTLDILNKIQYNPNSKVLIFINDLPFKAIGSIIKKSKNVQIITEKWIPGSLTKNYSNRKKFPLVIVFSKTNNKSISNECQKLKIPTIFFANLDFDFMGSCYPVPTNMKNIKSFYLLISLFKKIL